MTQIFRLVFQLSWWLGLISIVAAIVVKLLSDLDTKGARDGPYVVSGGLHVLPVRTGDARKRKSQSEAQT